MGSWLCTMSLGRCGIGPYMEGWGGASCPVCGMLEEGLGDTPLGCLGEGREMRTSAARDFFKLDFFFKNMNSDCITY